MTDFIERVPGAVSALTRVFDALWQHEVMRCRPGIVPHSDLQHHRWNGPGSAVHHCVAHRVRDTETYFTGSGGCTVGDVGGDCVERAMRAALAIAASLR